MRVSRIIRWNECAEIAWKNGGGTTRELAAFPDASGLEDFYWRLSVAKVDAPGDFSIFPGVDRVLAVLEGSLEISGQDVEMRLYAGGFPICFDGADEVRSIPLDGPVLNLNAMARRGFVSIEMSWMRAGDAIEPNGATFFVATEPQCMGEDRLARFDCLEIDKPAVVGGGGARVSFIGSRAASPQR